MSEVNEMTAIPLRKKYYDGEQVISAVGQSGADYETMMKIFKALSDMDSADKDYDQGFIDGARYVMDEAMRNITFAAEICKKVKKIPLPDPYQEGEA